MDKALVFVLFLVLPYISIVRSQFCCQLQWIIQSDIHSNIKPIKPCNLTDRVICSKSIDHGDQWFPGYSDSEDECLVSFPQNGLENIVKILNNEFLCQTDWFNKSYFHENNENNTKKDEANSFAMVKAGKQYFKGGSVLQTYVGSNDCFVGRAYDDVDVKENDTSFSVMSFQYIGPNGSKEYSKDVKYLVTECESGLKVTLDSIEWPNNLTTIIEDTSETVTYFNTTVKNLTLKTKDTRIPFKKKFEDKFLFDFGDLLTGAFRYEINVKIPFPVDDSIFLEGVQSDGLGIRYLNKSNFKYIESEALAIPLEADGVAEIIATYKEVKDLGIPLKFRANFTAIGFNGDEIKEILEKHNKTISNVGDDWVEVESDGHFRGTVIFNPKFTSKLKEDTKTVSKDFLKRLKLSQINDVSQTIKFNSHKKRRAKRNLPKSWIHFRPSLRKSPSRSESHSDESKRIVRTRIKHDPVIELNSDLTTYRTTIIAMKDIADNMCDNL